jgi:hypothetical protein
MALGLSSEISICQRAMAAAEHDLPFAGFTDPADGAFMLLHYHAARQHVLEALDWSFARRWAVLEQVTGLTGPVLMPYGFPVPPDVIRIRLVDDPRSARWVVSGRHVFADCEGPLRVRYTAQADNPGDWPEGFASCVVAYLGGLIAPRFTRSQNRATILFERFQDLLDAAAAAEAREQSAQPAWDWDDGTDPAAGLGAAAGWGY